MAQGYAALRGGGGEPFRVLRGGTADAGVLSLAAVTIAWSGAADPPWPAGTAAVSAYGGAVDTTAYAWLLCAKMGAPHPILVHEQDYPLNMDSVVGGTWARLRKLEGSSLWPIPEV